MQDISDGAALAAAAEFGLSTPDEETIKEVAKAYIHTYDKDMGVNVVVDEETQEVKINLEKHWNLMFIHFVNASALPIKTSTTAARVGTDNLCILALDENSSANISIEGKAAISAESCSVYSNSSSAKSISLDKGASLRAKSVCSAGGYVGSISPLPIVDCPIVSAPS